MRQNVGRRSYPLADAKPSDHSPEPREPLAQTLRHVGWIRCLRQHTNWCPLMVRRRCRSDAPKSRDRIRKNDQNIEISDKMQQLKVQLSAGKN